MDGNSEDPVFRVQNATCYHSHETLDFFKRCHDQWVRKTFLALKIRSFWKNVSDFCSYRKQPLLLTCDLPQWSTWCMDLSLYVSDLVYHSFHLGMTGPGFSISDGLRSHTGGQCLTIDRTTELASIILSVWICSWSAHTEFACHIWSVPRFPRAAFNPICAPKEAVENLAIILEGTLFFLEGAAVFWEGGIWIQVSDCDVAILLAAYWFLPLRKRFGK